MLNMILRWIVFALAIIFVAWIIPGISVDNFLSAMLVCIVLALINAFIKPLLQIISLPINILTLGLFTLVINALLMMFAGYITPGFEVEGFVSALLGSILLSLLSIGINKI
ncbi:MAG: phage holin family protein [Cyanobacteria bacterium SIG26]|nr:phage holin family protein [Cyanobacteria bacterium SIG26]